MAFKDILGQDRVIGWLKVAIKRKRLATAYLFTGLEGVGKTTVALTFAKVLNCLAPEDEDACERCQNCRKINANVHPDILLIQPKGKGIKIEQVRQLQEVLSFKPMSAKKRVVVIDKVETMAPPAANAFLKTLEEPPLNTLFILIAQDKYQLLPTIVSRCQIVPFQPLSLKIIKEMLEKKGVHSTNASFFALLSEGSLGRAQALLKKEIDVNLLIAWLKEPKMCNWLKLIASLDINLKTPEDTLNLLDFYQGIWRDILLVKNNCKAFLINKNILKEYEKMASTFTNQDIGHILTRIEEAKKLVKQNVQKKLILEHLLLRERMFDESHWSEI